MTSSINLSDEHLQTVVANAILGELTPEARQSLIGEAVKSLLAKKSGRYSETTALQEAFNTAVYAVAQTIAREELGNDEGIKQQVRDLFIEAWTKATTGENREKLVDKTAEAMSNALKIDRY